MSSSYGKNLTVTIFGQSHSAAIGVTMDGFPAGFPVDMEALGRFLARRAPGPVRPRRHQRGYCLHQAAEHYILAGLLAAEHRRCPRQKGEQTGNGKCYHPAEQHW